jgi:hypothetical protein
MSMAVPPAEVSSSLPSARAPTAYRRQLSNPARLRLAVEVVLAYATARRALRDAPIDTAVARLRASSAYGAGPTPSEAHLHEARHLSRAVTRTLALLPGDTRCLMQALVLIRLLARRGIPATIVIGARTTPTFFAHAWVVHAGQPILATGDGLFHSLVEL